MSISENMTASDLAVEIKNGRTDLYPELWEKVRSFVAYMAIRRYQFVNDTSAIDIDDLIQSGYFAVVNAVIDYDPASGYKYTTYLKRHLQRAFNEACGTAWERTANDPIHSAISLSEPIGDDDGPTIGDLMVSPVDYAEAVEDEVYRQKLHNAIERLLSRLSKAGADVIRRSYFDGEKMGDIAKSYCISEARLQSRRSGYLMQLRALSRSTPEGVELRKYVEENTDYYMQVGPESFARTHTSAPEAITLRRDQLERTYLHNKWNGD